MYAKVVFFALATCRYEYDSLVIAHAFNLQIETRTEEHAFIVEVLSEIFHRSNLIKMIIDLKDDGRQITTIVVGF